MGGSDARKMVEPDGSDKRKRVLHRSPNYPVFSLDDAIKKVRLIYEAERKAATTAEVIQKHLGYEKPSGSGGRAVSALRQYGLLDEDKGKYRVSESGYHLIMLPEYDPKWIVALKRAAGNPTIFAKLKAEYPSGLPSDETLRSHLITEEGFNPASVGDFIRVFRQTIEFAARLGPDQPSPSVADASETDPIRTEQTRTGGTPHAQGETRAYIWPLSIPRNVRAELRIIGDKLQRSDIERLKKQIDLLIEALVEEPPGQS